ncbi:MAG: hypothetical protein AAFP89_10535 [Bacteroidota bacterium]
MRTRIITLLILISSVNLTAQEKLENADDLKRLAVFYKDYMFRNEPSRSDRKQLSKLTPKNLEKELAFILESTKTNHNILTEKFLVLPHESVLKNLYIVRCINFNLRKEDGTPYRKLADSLYNQPIPRYELIDSYYDMMLTSVGNKNRPLDLSKYDFQLDKYGFEDDTEKGIFFLKVMNQCLYFIWGYMNVAKPMNTEKALDLINKYPRINGKAYFQFQDLYFPDFEMMIDIKNGVESYKGYYLNKYYELLIYHLICLNKENGTIEQKRDLLLGSILKAKNLYKYTEYTETLNKIFENRN